MFKNLFNLQNLRSITSLLTIILVFTTCSRVSYSHKSDPPKTVFLSTAEKTGLPLEQVKKDYFTLTDKTLVLLPFYTEITELPKTDNNHLDYLFKTTKSQLPTTELVTAGYYYADYKNYSPNSPIISQLKTFQKLLYEVSVSERSLSSSIGQLNQADLILTGQVDYWPKLSTTGDFFVLKDMEIQLRLIDAKYGTILWTGIDLITVDPGSELNKEAANLIANLLFELAENFKD